MPGRQHRAAHGAAGSRVIWICPECRAEVQQPETEFSDTALLNYLQRRLDRANYTGRCVLRESHRGHGFRLHETSAPNGVPSVREAIAAEMRAERAASDEEPDFEPPTVGNERL